MTAIWCCDTEEEYEEKLQELEENPDFTLVGTYDMIQDIYYEFEENGFTDEQTEQFTKNRYGSCLEIIHYLYEYTAYFGTR